jgi:hypothetical protein
VTHGAGKSSGAVTHEAGTIPVRGDTTALYSPL